MMMEFDDSLFLSDEASGTGSVDDGGEKANEGDRKKATEPVYIPKNCPPEWFSRVDVDSAGGFEEEAHVILKYRADLCYRKQMLESAITLYLRIIEVLPSSNRVVYREVKDSLARCYLCQGEFSNALSCAEELLAPPHNKDASSWQLLAHCYKGLGEDNFEDYVICLQKCNLLQRHNTSVWLELAEAYTTLATRSIFSTTAVTSHVESKFSNKHSTDASSESTESSIAAGKVETEKFATILSNTVTLLRPYFKWTSTEEDTMEHFHEIEISSRLLGRQLSVDEFLGDLIQLSWKQRQESLRVLFHMSSRCCLIWARQLHGYSARHCGSFAKGFKTEKLERIEHLIGGCHDNLTHYLVQCFNQSAIFEENISD